MANKFEGPAKLTPRVEAVSKEKKIKRFSEDVFESWKIRIRDGFKKADSTKKPEERRFILQQIKTWASGRADQTEDKEQFGFFTDAWLSAQHALDNLSRQQIEKIQQKAITWGQESAEQGRKWTEEDVKELAKHINRQNEFYFPEERESVADFLARKLKQFLGIKG